MKPIKFKESNVTYGKGQESIEELPALLFDDGEVVSCWKLSFTEVLRLLFTRKVWLGVATYCRPLQPTFMSTKKSDLFTVSKDETKG